MSLMIRPLLSPHGPVATVMVMPILMLKALNSVSHNTRTKPGERGRKSCRVKRRENKRWKNRVEYVISALYTGKKLPTSKFKL